MPMPRRREIGGRHQPDEAGRVRRPQSGPNMGAAARCRAPRLWVRPSSSIEAVRLAASSRRPAIPLLFHDGLHIGLGLVGEGIEGAIAGLVGRYLEGGEPLAVGIAEEVVTGFHGIVAVRQVDAEGSDAGFAVSVTGAGLEQAVKSAAAAATMSGVIRIRAPLGMVLACA